MKNLLFSISILVVTVSTSSYAMLSQIRKQGFACSGTRLNYFPFFKYNNSRQVGYWFWNKESRKSVYRTNYYPPKLHNFSTVNRTEQENFDDLCKTENGCLGFLSSIEENSDCAPQFTSRITKKHLADSKIVSWEENGHMFYDFAIKLMDKDPEASNHFSSLIDKDIFVLLAKNNVQCECSHRGRFLSRLIQKNPRVIKKIYSFLDRKIVVELADDYAGRIVLKELIKKDIDLLVYLCSLVKKEDKKKLAKLLITS